MSDHVSAQNSLIAGHLMGKRHPEFLLDLQILEMGELDRLAGRVIHVMPVHEKRHRALVRGMTMVPLQHIDAKPLIRRPIAGI